ncbi:glycoside hydrolase superfamily [Mycotypha africana]|uniref:glycoside hydrolase superfamily n=1 Tax=Mycotypha africana TaxID=64632 RepID=UPI00230193AF|nr:glycoside hydrolase superfamily [Mycotypha africana]KAI8968442.1 glycoside hydrolase superfamily [Mycotypha africana]
MKKFLLITSAIITLLSTVVFGRPGEEEYLANNNEHTFIQILSWDEAYEKARPLVEQMSLEQKVNITTGLGWEGGRCVGNTGSTINPDFPELCLQDSPLGIRFADGVSSGVAGVNAAASFDKEAIRRRGEYMGAEFRAKGIHVQLGPGVNMLRAPEGGRLWEGFGEDPYLAGIAAAETIRGIQSQGVMATVKHIIGNEQEINREKYSSEIDERTINEIYLWPFARAVEADVASVMCAYNQVNGQYACENDYVLNQLLKTKLGFRGFVQSDWAATHSTDLSVLNGLDMTMPGDITFHSGDSYFGANLTKAVKEGRIDEDRVTDMAMRIVASWYKVRQDEGFPETNIDSFRPENDKHINVQGNHHIDIRQLGAASTVLLKNDDNILPLSISRKRKLAVIGSDAGPAKNVLNCPDHGCNDGTLAQGWGSGTAAYPYLITPYEGIKSKVGDRMTVTKYLDHTNLKKAAKTASDADIAIVFANSNSGEEFIVVDNHRGDRNDLNLWNNGDELIKAVADANENTIVVIHSVGPVNMPWVRHPNIKAILWPGLPGQESGNSLADVLFGDVNPSAKLPYTIAKNPKHYPATISLGNTTEHVIPYEEGLYIGYRWFDKNDIEPLYPFGHGLSYTKFQYSHGRVQVVQGRANNITVYANITISNVGHYDGAEVVQLYLTYPAIAEEPPRILRGFEKVFIPRGCEETVSFKLSKEELSYYAVIDHDWVVPRGDFVLHVGSSSRDIKFSKRFTLD